jgi:hypothetical protein
VQISEFNGGSPTSDDLRWLVRDEGKTRHPSSSFDDPIRHDRARALHELHAGPAPGTMTAKLVAIREE